MVVTITTQGCQGQDNEINYLEHVQVFVNISHNDRGNLAIYLKSPQGKFRQSNAIYLIFGLYGMGNFKRNHQQTGVNVVALMNRF